MLALSTLLALALVAAAEEKPKGPAPIILKINPKGEIVVLGKPNIADLDGKRKHIKALANELRKTYPDRKEVVAEVSVVIHAEAETEYDLVYEILQIFKETGFKKLQLRARTKE